MAEDNDKIDELDTDDVSAETTPEPDSTEGEENTDTDESDAPSPEEITALANRIAETKLTKMKQNMNALDRRNKELIKKSAQLEANLKKAEQRKIDDETKISAEMQQEISELKAAKAGLESELADVQCQRLIEEAFSSLPSFSSVNAKAMAMRELRDIAKKNPDTGIWMARGSNDALEDYIKNTYARNPENFYLFKRKENKGAGSPDPSGVPNAFDPNTMSLLDEKGNNKYSNEDLLKMFSGAS